MKKIIAVATLIAAGFALSMFGAIGMAEAGDKIVTTTSNCGSSYNRTSSRAKSDCETTTVIQNLKSWKEMDAEERAQVRADEAVVEARIVKWEAFCKPVVKQDINGINRYQYAHKNCDMGRSE